MKGVMKPLGNGGLSTAIVVLVLAPSLWSAGEVEAAGGDQVGSIEAAEEGNSVINIPGSISDQPDINEYFTKTHTLPGEDYREPIEEYQGMISNVGSKVRIGSATMSTDVAMNVASSQTLLSPKAATEAPKAVKKSIKKDPSVAGARFVYSSPPTETPLALMAMPEPQSKDSDCVHSKIASRVDDTQAYTDARKKDEHMLLLRIAQLEKELAKVDGPGSPLLTKKLSESIIYGAHAVAASQEGEMGHQSVKDYTPGGIEDIHALDEEAGKRMKVKSIDDPNNTSDPTA